MAVYYSLKIVISAGNTNVLCVTISEYEKPKLKDEVSSLTFSYSLVKIAGMI